MHKLITIIATILGTSTAFAGTVTFVAPETVAIEEPVHIGNSGASPNSSTGSNAGKLQLKTESIAPTAAARYLKKSVTPCKLGNPQN